MVAFLGEAYESGVGGSRARRHNGIALRRKDPGTFPCRHWFGTGDTARDRGRQAAAFLRENPPPGKMWNAFNYGGYLLYALSPQHKKVFIDGRNDTVYPEAFFAETARADRDPA